MRVPEEQVDEAVEIMKRHHAVNIDERVAVWRAGGCHGRADCLYPLANGHLCTATPMTALRYLILKMVWRVNKTAAHL
jgi:hypothetical protein